MTYTVFTLAEEEGEHGSGLTLTEAFARMMALAGCDYAFGRAEGVMCLTITHHEDVPEEYLADPVLREHFFPTYRSKLVDDDMARAELMRRFMKRGMKGYLIVTDEEYRQQEAARSVYIQAGLRSHHRIFPRNI